MISKGAEDMLCGDISRTNWTRCDLSRNGGRVVVGAGLLGAAAAYHELVHFLGVLSEAATPAV